MTNYKQRKDSSSGTTTMLSWWLSNELYDDLIVSLRSFYQEIIKFHDISLFTIASY
jgi:hypothetical protein